MALTQVPALGSMTLLSTTSVSSGTSVTISNISSSYTDLQIIGRNLQLNTGDDLYLRLNGNTGANYVWQHFKLSGSTVTGNNNSGSATSFFIGSVGSESLNWNIQGYFKIDIPRYSGLELHQVYSQNRSYAGAHLYYNMTGMLNEANAVSSITLFTSGGATFSSGSIYIYGVK